MQLRNTLQVDSRNRDIDGCALFAPGGKTENSRATGSDWATAGSASQRRLKAATAWRARRVNWIVVVRMVDLGFFMNHQMDRGLETLRIPEECV